MTSGTATSLLNGGWLSSCEAVLQWGCVWSELDGKVEAVRRSDGYKQKQPPRSRIPVRPALTVLSVNSTTYTVDSGDDTGQCRRRCFRPRQAPDSITTR